MKLRVTAACAAAIMLTGCLQHDRRAEPAPPALQLSATIQDLMDAEVDPSADYLWDAVGSTVTAKGTEDRRPRTEEDWGDARRRAIILAEVPNLLIMRGRAVADPAKVLADSVTQGITSPAEIRAAIDRDQPAFAGFAKGLQRAALQALTAIDAHNADGLMEAGARIDEACEACHLRYWYPNSPRPPAPRTP